MVNQDDSFIREVNDELRSDQMKAVWRRFGGIIIGIAVLIVLGTVGKVGYDYWQEASSSQSGDTFLAALNLARENKSDEALAALTELEKDGYGSYPVLAQLRVATLQAQKGETDSAVAAFSGIGRDTRIPAALRDAARLRAAYLLIDAGTYEQVSSEVEQLAVPQNAMRHSAREALGLSAYKAGDYAKAKSWFQQIVDDAQSPRGIMNRAQMLLDVIASTGKA
ncbi:tetratricopeptide repeat protein [Sinorhizobium meliloti]|uniref:tetratricopeptide repeat protein n=1 Tax=Rhizobium meliloti TaxID=382 RepID=UPI000FDCD819|nr:tetratricopeptide repeat protein [Sinorhizobium meliloti]MDW9412471.1 tetratricopeptide repeat protein [Sinorhizobium meliloti]MDW9445584.1 tetratricopeptide repeat protein [Sinorhizobium meliloti]MDW9457926.1 tetratricopeptide repeat protein [Sinorhizobium meliloti]MDW9470334.1 tetratricopeptide repeat protein [Sinorhizobium meliloti]MDW9558777.1 tetratricopeptide repeat protein [Sinorhizobium meliloti]